MNPFKLEDNDKKDIFKVPPSYFEKLPINIQNRILDEKKKPAISLFTGSGQLITAVVCLAIVVITSVFFLRDHNPEQSLASRSTEKTILIKNADTVFSNNYLKDSTSADNKEYKELLAKVSANEIINYLEEDETFELYNEDWN